MAVSNSTLTQERLKELLHYDPDTGIFTWRIRRGMALAGSVAGSARNSGRITIYVDSRQYDAARLAWLYMYGEFPPKDLRRKNSDFSDNRIANFHDPHKPMPKVVHAPLTSDRLRELVNYDPSTGIFTRRRIVGKVGRIGDVIGCKSQGRLEISVDGKIYFAHRLAWLYMTGKWPEFTIDHIDGNPLNNRFCNLRDVPQKINNHNIRKPRGKSGIIGVHKRFNKWRAEIVTDGKSVFIGSFNTAEEARAAYVEAKRIYHVGCTI